MAIGIFHLAWSASAAALAIDLIFIPEHRSIVIEFLGGAVTGLIDYLRHGLKNEISNAPYATLIFITVILILSISVIWVLFSSSRVRAQSRIGLFLPDALRDWPRSIIELIDRHRGESSLHGLVAAFLYKYANQEYIQISGEVRDEHTPPEEQPRNRIYTSFVSYSELVRVILGQELTKAAGEEVVCFATISMPLPQWFNNKVYRTSSNDFSYREVTGIWSSYAQSMHMLARRGVGSSATKIYRLLQVRESPPRIGAFFDELEMKNLARSKILLPCNQDGEIDYPAWPIPLSRQRREEIVARILPVATRNLIAKLYEGVAESYLIIPLEMEPKNIPGYHWIPVWQAFINLYAPPETGRVHSASYLYRINQSEFAELFRHDDGIPNDAFVVGKRAADKTSIDWLFYLSGTTDEGCQMVRLEYGTELTGGDRIQKIKNFANDRIREIEHGANPDHLVPLDRWLTQ